MNYDKILSKIFFIDDWHFNLSNLNKYKRHYKMQSKYKNIINYISNRYNDSTGFKETLYRIRHNCENRPVCKTCGGYVNFLGKGNRLYADYCSNKCAGKNKETILKKQASDRSKHNGKLGWNINTPEKIENRKLTLIKKYGSWENACKEIEIKHQIGMIEKYGDSIGMHIDSIKQKRNDTLRKNSKYNKSKDEELSYELLKTIFNEKDIVRQYSSTEYPFNCDFYIKSLNLYIECQYSHFHNYKKFENTPEDLIQLNELYDKSKQLKNKNKCIKTQYDSIIYTWTDLDVRKRNIAKQNNLNFKEIWTYKEMKTYVNELYKILWKNASLYLYKKSNDSFRTNHNNIDNPMHIKEYIDKWKQSCKLSKTMYGTSKEEIKIYNLLLEKYNDTILHYSSSEYPFECDFYIPSLNLYIEYNGHQTHGGHPYNKNDDNDIILAQKLKNIFGSNLTFTKRDPYKRYIAKQNHLNYKELWNIKEAKEYINNL